MENELIYVESLKKTYTEKEFISLDQEERERFVKALSLKECATLINKVKYLYNEDADTQLDAVISFLAAQQFAKK